MPTLDYTDILNAPMTDTFLRVPSGGVFILKQLLSQYVGWGDANGTQKDELDSILAKTMELEMVQIGGLVFHGILPYDFVTVSGGEATLEFTEAFSNPDYLTLSSGATFSVTEGEYQVIFTIRVNSFSTGLSDYLHRTRIRASGGNQIRVWEAYQPYPGMSFTWSTVVTGPLSFYFTWNQLSGGNVGLLQQADSTRLQIIKL